MISLKNAAQISKMRDAGKILYEVEQEVRQAIRPGVTTAELDILAERLIRKNRAIPSSLHYEGYPCSICASINDEVVHGIPSDRRVLKEGDIISIDCTLLLDGWQADSAFTAAVGKVSIEAEKLIREFTGHGIGREMHEDPSVLNYGESGRGLRLRGGMTLAVEPMISAGDWHLSVDDDGWCARTVDHSLTAHYEHTIAVQENGLPEILTLPGFSWEAEG